MTKQEKTDEATRLLKKAGFDANGRPLKRADQRKQDFFEKRILNGGGFGQGGRKRRTMKIGGRPK